MGIEHVLHLPLHVAGGLVEADAPGQVELVVGLGVRAGIGGGAPAGGFEEEVVVEVDGRAAEGEVARGDGRGWGCGGEEGGEGSEEERDAVHFLRLFFLGFSSAFFLGRFGGWGEGLCPVKVKEKVEIEVEVQSGKARQEGEEVWLEFV